MEAITNLSLRESHKRKVSPSWKLCEYLGMDSSNNKKRKYNYGVEGCAETVSSVDAMESDSVNVTTIIPHSMGGNRTVSNDFNDAVITVNQDPFQTIKSKAFEVDTGGNISVNKELIALENEDKEEGSNTDSCASKVGVTPKAENEIIMLRSPKQEVDNCIQNYQTVPDNAQEMDSKANVKVNELPTSVSDTVNYKYSHKSGPEQTFAGLSEFQFQERQNVLTTARIRQDTEIRFDFHPDFSDTGNWGNRASDNTTNQTTPLTNVDEDNILNSDQTIEENVDVLPLQIQDRLNIGVNMDSPKQSSNTDSVQVIVETGLQDTLERFRKQQHAVNLSSLPPLRFIIQNESVYTYYLLPTKLKSDNDSKSAKRKKFTSKNTDGTKYVDTKKSTRKVADNVTCVSVKLEDHSDSYCIEEYTDFSTTFVQNSGGEKQRKRFLCKLCNSFRTLLKDEMESHIALHLNGKLNCGQCQFIASTPLKLRNHLKEDHQVLPKNAKVCEFCGITKSNLDSYKRHVSKVHGKAAFECSQCENTYHTKKDLREHMLNKHKCSTFQCNKCTETFLSNIGLNTHRKQCGMKLYRCKYCNFVRSSLKLFSAHVKNVHTKKSTHKCNMCPFLTSKKQQLTDHMNAHLGVHPYKCKLCEFSCVKKYQLTSHQRTHSGEKKYKCQKCSYAAAWNVQLKSHLKAHDSKTQCICKVCSIVLKDQRCLTLHEKKEHGSKISENLAGKM